MGVIALPERYKCPKCRAFLVATRHDHMRCPNPDCCELWEVGYLRGWWEHYEQTRDLMRNVFDLLVCAVDHLDPADHDIDWVDLSRWHEMSHLEKFAIIAKEIDRRGQTV